MTVTATDQHPPPIAVIAYNRPQFLSICLDALDRSMQFCGKKLPITIFIDAPKNEKAKEAVLQTIEVAKQRAGATLVVRETNQGFANISNAISEMCHNYGKVIVVEDDIIVAPDFLSFMIQGLEKYQYAENVYMLSGFMYFEAQPKSPETFFHPYAFAWGFAIWERAWNHFRWDISDFAEFSKQFSNRYLINCLGSYKFSKLITRAMENKMDSFAARWFYRIIKDGASVLSPSTSLVWNCGCGNGTNGTQERENYIHGNLSIEDFKKPRLMASPEVKLSFPSQCSWNKKAMHHLAICFLQERLLREKKQHFRKRCKILYHKFCTKL